MGLESLNAARARIASISGAIHANRGVSIGSSAHGISNGASNPDFAAALAKISASSGTASATGSAATGSGATQLLPTHNTIGSNTRPVGTAGRFVADALSQSGKPYVFGAEVDLNDPNPKAFDCSELVQWSASRQGVQMREGSWEQYLQLKDQGQLMSVEEALHTPGALLFSFSHEPKPGEGRPSKAHVAISLGDGRTIEAKGRKYGVGVFTATNRFQYAGRVPGLTA